MRLIDADKLVKEFQDLLYQEEDYIVGDDILWYDGFNKAIKRAIKLTNKSQEIVKHGHQHSSCDCDYCDGAKPLVIGDTNDKGIAVHSKGVLNAYGYDIHGPDSDGLVAQINYCPMCGKQLVR